MTRKGDVIWQPRVTELAKKLGSLYAATGELSRKTKHVKRRKGKR